MRLSMDDIDNHVIVARDNPVAYATMQGHQGLEELRDTLRPGYARWWAFGIWPGSFLRALIENDLMGAFAKADDENKGMMRLHVEWLFMFGDSRCIKENAEAWHLTGGFLGQLLAMQIESRREANWATECKDRMTQADYTEISRRNSEINKIRALLKEIRQ